MPKIVLASAQIRAGRATALTDPKNPDYRKFTLLVSQDAVVYEIVIVENESVEEEQANNPHFFRGAFGNMASVMFPGVKACYDKQLTRPSKVYFEGKWATYPKGTQLVYLSIKDVNPYAVLEPSGGGILTKKTRNEILVGKLNEQSRRHKLQVFWNSKVAKAQASGEDERGIRYTVCFDRTGVAKGPKNK